MDGYPVNLILTVAIASATLFLGFLPTKKIRPEFFARETLWAALGWLIVAVLSPPAILHYPLILGVLCLAAWWQFREDNLFKAKMWLTLASALGISVGVILILAVTPRANPPGIPLLNETLLLSSIYLGGVIIGLAYVCFALTQGANVKSGISHSMVYRHVVLLQILALTRAAVLLGSCYYSDIGLKPRPTGSPYHPSHFLLAYGPRLELLLLGLAVVFLPALAFLAKRAAHFSSRVQPIRILIAVCAVGFLAEILARLLAL